MKIFPEKIDFFEIFEKAAANLTNATFLLVDLLEHFETLKDRAKEIYELEHDSDMITHDLMRKLNKSFITPIDREDIHALASRMDDILDRVWSGVDRLVVFKITEPTVEALDIAKDLWRTAEIIQKSIKDLREKNYSYVLEHCIEINRLENRIDRLFRDALARLFDDFSSDHLLIIKWKEIYELLEEASDRCEDVANVLETIVIKNA
jgi:uncharacterized protein